MSDPDETSMSLPIMEPEGAPPTAAFTPGSRVLVAWSDGKRYPGVIKQTGCLVQFDSGQEQWIPSEHLFPEGR